MCHVCMIVIQDPKSLTIKPREKKDLPQCCSIHFRMVYQLQSVKTSHKQNAQCSGNTKNCSKRQLTI